MFRNLKLGAKLVSGFIIVALLGTAVASIGICNLARINRMLESMYANALVPVVDLSAANLQATYYSRALRDYVIELEKPEMQKTEQKMQGFEAEFEQRIAAYGATHFTERERQILVQVKPQWTAFEQATRKMMALSYEGRNEEAAVVIRNETFPRYQLLEKSLQELTTINNELAQQTAAESASVYRNGRAWMLGGEPVVLGGLADAVHEVVELEPHEINEPPTIGLRWRTELILGMDPRGERFTIILDIERVFSTADVGAFAAAGAA
ncbi:MAG: MCP four helix bundle domain-containing protein [Opitutaceae bacterium]